MEWVTITRRTDDPKLTWLERKLAERGIPSRRDGYSFHAPILKIPVEHEDSARALLNQPFDESGQTVDDVPDDDPVFTEL